MKTFFGILVVGLVIGISSFNPYLMPYFPGISETKAYCIGIPCLIVCAYMYIRIDKQQTKAQEKKIQPEQSKQQMYFRISQEQMNDLMNRRYTKR